MEQSLSWEADRSVFSYSRNSPHFMEPEGSLLHSQEPATCPYPEPQPTRPCPHPTYLRYILILSSLLCLGLPSGLLPSGFPTKTLYAPLLSPIRATFRAHSPCMFRNMSKFLQWAVVSTSPNPQTVGPLHIGCPRLLIQYIRSYPPYVEA